MNDRPLVRASDIGLSTFCRRAWWLAHVRDVPHQRPAVLAKGTQAHQAHGQAVQHAQWQVKLGWYLLALGLLAAGLILLWGVIQGTLSPF